MAADKHNHCIVLPFIVIARRPIRFLTLHANGCFSTTGWDKKTDGQYLFLGTDVVAGLSQTAKNSPRFHSNYMESGMTTKVIFPDARLDNIHNSNAVWFYNIQGLFKLAFEYRGTEEQKDCMMKLRDDWMNSLSAPSIPESITLTWSQHSEFMPPHSSVSLLTIDGNPRTDFEDLMEIDNESRKSRQFQISNEHTSSASPELLMENLHVDAAGLIKADLRATSRKTCQLCGGCAVGNARPPTLAREVLERALCSVQALQNRDGLSAAEEAELGILKVVLDFVHLDLQHQTNENNCFPLVLLESYVNLMRSQGSTVMDNNFSIPGYRNAALMVICQWLGQALHALEPVITEKVKSFKEHNIKHLGNLPKAKNLISHLFPLCMQVLISNWCGFADLDLTDRLEVMENGKVGSEEALPDHSYSSHVVGGRAPAECSCPEHQPDSLTPLNPYPIIQHTLELVCNNLVAGESHVVYALLRLAE